MKIIQGGVCAATGFKANGIHCGIRKNKTKRDIALIYSEVRAAAAAVYTTNLVKGAPLVVTKNHIANGIAQAVICNSGNANTCNANGIEIAEGMATSILLPGYDSMKVWDCLSQHYEGQKLVTVAPLGGDESVIYASTLAGKDSMRLIVSGHEGQTMVTALFDNLGKGASGAAIQNMNILLGIDEATGLNV